MYPVIQIAQYIIWYCQIKNYIISNLKLQKILYFVQAEFLVSKNIPCFTEKIEAWSFGLVVPAAYDRYIIFGNAHIPCADTTDNDNSNIIINDRKLINEIVDVCAPYTAPQLTQITFHQKPWINFYERYRRNEIPQQAIKDFFAE